jgi:hypothetical protein
VTDHDRLIDDAARAMTAEPSPVDLRARVIEEIRGTSLQARHSGEAKASYYKLNHAWWLAAAAGILLAAYLGWPARQPVELPARVVEWPLPTQAPAPVIALVPRASTESAAPARTRPAAAPRAIEPTIASIPALEAPYAIGIAPLDTGPTPLPPLDVDAPLEIETLDIKPLVSPPTATGGQ